MPTRMMSQYVPDPPGFDRSFVNGFLGQGIVGKADWISRQAGIDKVQIQDDRWPWLVIM